MKSVEAAILRTLLYADIFHFAMTPAELHRHLITSQFTSLEEVQNTLKQSEYLNQFLIQADGFITLKNRHENITRRVASEQYVDAMWDDAVRYGQWLAQIPFVRMVAMTGALAVRNPVNEADDYDYLLVTQPGRVWIARALAIVLVRIVRLRKRELCPNYVLASDKLQQQRQDLFMAREIVQMFPIYGSDLYHEMMSANDWFSSYLANARPFPTQEDTAGLFKTILESLLSGWLGDKLEQWEYQRKRRKFETQTRKPGSAALIDSGHVKGHFNDNGHPVLQKYQVRLQEYGLHDETALELAGD